MSPWRVMGVNRDIQQRKVESRVAVCINGCFGLHQRGNSLKADNLSAFRVQEQGRTHGFTVAIFIACAAEFFRKRSQGHKHAPQLPVSFQKDPSILSWFPRSQLCLAHGLPLSEATSRRK